MKLSCSLIAFLFSISAFAQNKVGNGGDVVHCKDKAPQVLDLFEGSNIIMTDESDYQKIVKDRLDNLSQASSKLSEQYRNKLSKFLSDTDFKPNARLVDINDSEHLFLPKDCVLQQAAIRKNISAKNEKLFLFDEYNWNKLDPLNKASLVMHEIIYDHLYKLGERNSLKVRKINALLFSKDFSSKKFWSLIQDLKLPIYP